MLVSFSVLNLLYLNYIKAYVVNGSTSSIFLKNYDIICTSNKFKYVNMSLNIFYNDGMKE